MLRRSALFGLAALGVLPLSACAPFYRYRYKLTLKVDDHGVAREASSVVECGEGVSHLQLDGGSRLTGYVRGEATALELGDGRLLIATLVKLPPEPELWIPKSNWDEGGAPLTVLGRVYGEPYPHYKDDISVGMDQLIAHRGARPISVDDLPDMVTFDDNSQPSTIRMVDCHYLTAYFGEGVTFAGATLEFTDEPITRSIETKLPWLKTLHGWLSGDQIVRYPTLSHRFDRVYFERQ